MEDSFGPGWLAGSLTSTYQQLSPNNRNDCTNMPPVQQESLEYSTLQNVSWQNKRAALKQSPHSDCEIHSENGLSPNALREPQSVVKKRSADPLYHVPDIDKKRKRNGYGGNNGASNQGWSTQVEELAEHLAADFEGSLSAIAVADLATAVAGYNSSIFHSSQGKGGAVQPLNGTVGNSPPENENIGQSTTNIHQLLYLSKEEYPATPPSGNQVSSSQQGGEFNEDCRFQYVLAAATSMATKFNEETLTYLNQGQSYEIKLKKLGDLSAYRGKILNSTIRLCFHERRLQYTEREQIDAWQKARPGEKLLEVDVPLSYGVTKVLQQNIVSNVVEFTWDPTKEVGVYIKINCISTEFTPKKHGGEKGVPFRIQVETRLPGGPRLHAASCQIKVFKLKGADRKHKQDRDKIMRRPPHEQDKYQSSCDCTVLADIPLETISTPPLPVQNNFGSPHSTIDSNQNSNEGNVSPVSTSSGCLAVTSSNVPVPSPEAIKTEKCNNSNSSLSSLLATLTETQTDPNVQACKNLDGEASPALTADWLRSNNFHPFLPMFVNYTGDDMFNLMRDDLIKMCGFAEGVRLHNMLHKSRGRTFLYFTMEDKPPSAATWRGVVLRSPSISTLIKKLTDTFNLPYTESLYSVYYSGPEGINVLLNDDMLANFADQSMFTIKIVKDNNSQQYKICLNKPVFGN